MSIFISIVTALFVMLSIYLVCTVSHMVFIFIGNSNGKQIRQELIALSIWIITGIILLLVEQSVINV